MIGLLLSMGLCVWLRCHTFAPTLRDRHGVDLWPTAGARSEPLDCDEAAYGYIGRRLAGGAVMYRDLTENKPPGGYWTYAAAVALGGPGETTVRVLAIPFVLATIAAIWALGGRLGGPVAAVSAAFAFAVASTDPSLFGNGSDFEHFMNFYSILSLYFVVRGGRWSIVAAGACLGASSLVKQVAGFHTLIYATYFLSARSRRVDFARFALGLGLIWAAAILALAIQGALGAAYEDAIRYGAALATDAPAAPNAPRSLIRLVVGNSDPRDGSLPWPFGSTDYVRWWGAGTWPLWLASLLGVPSLVAGGGVRGRRLAAAWLASSWAQVAAPGLYWQHYYLLPLPGAALAVGVALGAGIEMRGHSKVAGLLMSAVMTASIVGTSALLVRDYLRVPAARLTIYNGGPQWNAQRDLGKIIGRRARIWKNPRLFVWGWQSSLYFYSGLDGVTPQVFNDPLLKAFAAGDHRLVRPRIERTMADLRARPPELIFCGDEPFPALAEYLRSRGYKNSTLSSRPGGGDLRGLWVEKSRFDAFEASR